MTALENGCRCLSVAHRVDEAFASTQNRSRGFLVAVWNELKKGPFWLHDLPTCRSKIVIKPLPSLLTGGSISRDEMTSPFAHLPLFPFSTFPFSPFSPFPTSYEVHHLVLQHHRFIDGLDACGHDGRSATFLSLCLVAAVMLPATLFAGQYNIWHPPSRIFLV